MVAIERFCRRRNDVAGAVLGRYAAAMRQHWVYILANRNRATYIGVTNNLTRRLEEHHVGSHSFTARYNIRKLVHFEVTSDVLAAITREKQLKGWLRRKKWALIESTNPEWKDLSADWTGVSTTDPSLRSG